MSSVSGNSFVEDLENCSVTELIASVRSVLERVGFQSVQKVVEALHTEWDKAEQVRSENEWFKNELGRLRSKKLRREDELRKCSARSRVARVVAERRGIAEDVECPLTKRVRRGGGGGGAASLKETFDELEGQDREQRLRVWVQKFEELNQRLFAAEERLFNAERSRSNAFWVVEKGNHHSCRSFAEAYEYCKGVS